MPAASATALSGAVPARTLRRCDVKARRSTARRAVRVNAAIAEPVAGKVRRAFAITRPPRTPARRPLRLCYPKETIPGDARELTLPPPFALPSSLQIRFDESAQVDFGGHDRVETHGSVHMLGVEYSTARGA